MTDRTSAARERYTDSKKKRETQRRKPVGRVEGRVQAVQRRGRQLPPPGRPVKIDVDDRRHEFCEHPSAWSTSQLEHMHDDNGPKNTGSLVVTLESDTRITRSYGCDKVKKKKTC